MKGNEILNAEMATFVKDSSTSFDTIKETFVSKVDLGKGLVAIFSQSKFNGSLQFIYNIVNNEILMITEYAKDILFKRAIPDKERTKYVDIITNLTKAIQDEFHDVIENMELDPILYKDEGVKEMAENALDTLSMLEYPIPKFNSWDEINLNEMASLCLDINEGAYNFLEKYLKSKPAFIRECQRVLVANKIFTEKLKKEGRDYSWKAIYNSILKILNDTSHKSVQICYELGNGEQRTESFKINSSLIEGLPPTYSIVKISWKKEVLYDRAEIRDDIDTWKTELSENEDFLRNRVWKSQKLFPKYYLFLSPKLLDNEEFCLSLLSSSNWNEILSIIPKKFSENPIFVGKLLKNSYYFKYYLNERIKEDSSLASSFPQFVGNAEFYNQICQTEPNCFAFFPLEMKQNKEIIKSLIEFKDEEHRFHNEIPNLTSTFLTKEVLNSEELIETVETLAKSYPGKVGVNMDVLEKFTDKDIILCSCQYTKDILNCSKIPSTLLNDKEWVIELLKYVRDFDFENVYSHLPKTLREDKDILALIFKYDKGDSKFQNRLISSGTMPLDDLYALLLDEDGEISFKAGQILNHLKLEYVYEMVKRNPFLIQPCLANMYGSLFSSDKENKELVKFAVKQNYMSIQGIRSNYLQKSWWIDLLKIDERVFEFIPENHYSEEVLSFVGKTQYILPKINEIRKSNPNLYKKLALDKDFVMHQATLNSDILKDILPVDKRIYGGNESLQEDKDFVLELIKLNPKNIYSLAKKSRFWKDLDFAEQVIKLESEAIDLFSKSISQKLKKTS